MDKFSKYRKRIKCKENIKRYSNKGAMQKLSFITNTIGFSSQYLNNES